MNLLYIDFEIDFERSQVPELSVGLGPKRLSRHKQTDMKNIAGTSRHLKVLIPDKIF